MSRRKDNKSICSLIVYTQTHRHRHTDTDTDTHTHTQEGTRCLLLCFLYQGRRVGAAIFNWTEVERLLQHKSAAVICVSHAIAVRVFSVRL